MIMVMLIAMVTKMLMVMVLPKVMVVLVMVMVVIVMVIVVVFSLVTKCSQDGRKMRESLSSCGPSAFYLGKLASLRKKI